VKDVTKAEAEREAAKGVDGSLADSCPTCGEHIPRDSELALHLDGLDASRPECARQDIERIAERERVLKVWPRALTGGEAW